MPAPRRSLVWIALVVILGLGLVDRALVPDATVDPDSTSHGGRRGEPGPYPSDWFAMQRAFPGTTIDQAKYRAALDQARVERANLESWSQTPGLSTPTYLTWTQAGPFNIGGRATALAVVPGGTTIYLGSANGGVFKSTNSGTNWSPIFDAVGVYSIGALALDPNDSQTIYVGTGEANASVDSYDGSGLFRSIDGGQNWTSLGLSPTARIARVAVDPSNSSRVFVAAMGTQFSANSDRGLYRSEDGGQSWDKVLFVNDSTGVCDVAINPIHPDTVFCASWERIRQSSYRRANGPGCGIWRSIDHGTTWLRLASGLPTPSDSVGRIALAIAKSRPSRIYAGITGGLIIGYNGKGFYRSDNGGANWSRVDVGAGYTGIMGGFGWYFGDIAVDPNNADRVWAMGVSVVRSTTAGVSFSNVTASSHPDQHAMWIDPSNMNHVFLGNDGGFYATTNGGSSWFPSTDLPISQFYAGAIDPSNPNRLLGGTQDNNCLQTSGSPTAWNAMLGGDGFYCLVDPTNSNVVFAESQFATGGSGPQRSISGGGGGTFSSPSGFVGSDRYNWCAPYVMDPSNHNVLLAGSHRVYRSTNNGQSYSVISGDLTTNPVSQLTYGTITTIDIAPSNSSYYYVGTDDGRVWRSTNAGGLWEDISGGLPIRWVTRVTADPLDERTVYVTLSGFSLDEHLAHVYRSTDAGDTWSPIAGQLPDMPANDILVDPQDTSRLYLATDVGVYASLDTGQSWFPLGVDMPIQTVFDLTLHSASRTLVAATHGRSQWRLDLSELPVAVGPIGAPARDRIALSAPAPNPSRASVAFSLSLAEGAEAEIVVFDPLGRQVREVFKGILDSGRHSFSWNGLDDGGRVAPTGVYYARALARGATGHPLIATRRLVRVN